MLFSPLLTIHVHAIGSLHSGLYLMARQNYTPGVVLRRLDREEAVLTATRRARPDPGNVFRYAACHAIMDSGYFPAFDRVHNIMSLLGPALRGEQVVLLKARKEYMYNRPLCVKCRSRRLWLVHQRANRTLPGDQQMGRQLEEKEAADLLKDCFPYADKRDYDKLEDIGTDSGPKLAALCQALSRWRGQQSGADSTALPHLRDIPYRVEIGRLFNHVKRGVEAGHILAFEYAPKPEQENMAAFTPSPAATSLTPSEIVRSKPAEEKTSKSVKTPAAVDKPPFPSAVSDGPPLPRKRYTWPGHKNAAEAEEELAKTIHNAPPPPTLRDEVVLRWGDVIGTHGADVISINWNTGQVTLWDSKYRSNPVTVQESKTFIIKSRRDNAVEQVWNVLKNDRKSTNPLLTKELYDKAIKSLNTPSFAMQTIGMGNATNRRLI
jgi:hypothetical protein